MLFELELNLCERFPNLSPFDVREKRFADVFLLIRRLNNHSNKENITTTNEPHYKKVNGKTRVYVPVKE